MTKTRYLLAIVLQKFGVTLKTRRLTEASYESHLMQDGEEILGAYCWQNVAEIEELSFEYWTLRGLDRKRKELLGKIQEAENRMQEAQERKMALRYPAENSNEGSARKREELSKTLDTLKEQVAEARAAALTTKKKHDAAKVKLNFLQEEDDAREDEVTKCHTTLSQLREIFARQKNDLEELREKADSCESQLDALDEELAGEVQVSEQETNQAYAAISQANRDITNFQASLSAIEEEQAGYFREIGHFLNLQSKESACQKVCKEHRAILTQIKLLNRSVQFNRALSARLEH